MSESRYLAFAATAPGLEYALVDELRELGVRATREPGGARFDANAETLYAVNIFSRLAGRVTVEVCHVKAARLELIANGVRAASWKRFITPGQVVEVRATLNQSKLRNRDAIANKVSLAIKDSMRGPRLPGPRPPRQPARVQIHVQGESARVSIDASGELLHRRGWRQATAKAPIRENYAAAMLRLAEWSPGETLVDPMCGSGTFCIEAATIALGLPPGAKRPFAFEHWPSFVPKTLQALRKEANSQLPLSEDGLFIACDRDSGAIKATRANAKRAGVAGVIHVNEVSFERLEAPKQTGLLIANPPYGQRVEGGQSDWAAYSRILRERWRGWRVALVVPPIAKRALSNVGVEEVASFNTGGIPVRILVGVVS